MDVKVNLTKQIADLEGIGVDTSLLLNGVYRCWWQNIRHNGNRSFRLTQEGYSILSKHLVFYKIDFLNTLIITNNTLIWLDNFIDCPYYMIDRTIYVSREKMAVQLILFGGDLNKFGKAKYLSSKRR